jgi:hypothetical protein
MNIVICGAGNGAHTLMALLGEKPEHAITVYTPLADEVAALKEAFDDGRGVQARLADGRTLEGRPPQVTGDPAQAAPGAELVLLALPAFAHEAVLRDLAPHLPPEAWVGAMPARGGFDWLARTALPDHEGVIFGMQTLPWSCRIQEWGRSVLVLGSKDEVALAAKPADAGDEVAAKMTELLGIRFQALPNFLALTLANVGQLIHPGIMYGLFHDWDGRPFGEDQVPLFYEGVDEEAAALLQAMSDEVQAVRAGLLARTPGLNLDGVLSLHQWLMRSYGDAIGDSSTLLSSFRTNRAYAGLRAPVALAEENAYVPWFRNRYLSEDAPTGLVATRGLAELVQVPTPAMDRVILWVQEKLDKEYLRAGRVAGRDLGETRAPQRFGLDLAGLVT